MFTLRRSNPEHADDRDLLLRMHRGDEAAARAVWSRHGPRLIAVAAGIVGRGAGDAAADTVQDVLCRLLEGPRDRVRAIEDVPAYLARAVRNEAMNRARGDQRRKVHAMAAAGLDRGGGALPAASDGDALGAALERLDPGERELLILKHAGGLTFDQLAAALDVNRSTAATRYGAAIRRLRTLMGSAAIEGGVP